MAELQQENQLLKEQLVRSQRKAQDLEEGRARLAAEHAFCPHSLQELERQLGQARSAVSDARNEVGSLQEDNLKLRQACSEEVLRGQVQAALGQVLESKELFLADDHRAALAERFGIRFYEWFSKHYRRHEAAQIELQKAILEVERLEKAVRNSNQDGEWLCDSLIHAFGVLSRFSQDSLPTTLALLRDELDEKMPIVTDKLKDLHKQRCRDFSQTAPQPSENGRLAT